MSFVSGASRTVIRTESPLRSHLTNVTPSNGSCTIGNGTRLPYVETGILTANNPATVLVEGLEFDLYSAVAAAKRGISAIIDFDPLSGEKRSFIYCKDSGEISPLIERRNAALEVPIHLTLSRKDTVGLNAKENESPRPACRDENKDALSLFTYDIVQSLNQRDKDFLLHSRLAHLPSKKILQLIHNGNTGLPFSGKLLDLLSPVYGKQTTSPASWQDYGTSSEWKNW